MGSKKLNIEGCMNMETLKKDNAHEMKYEWKMNDMWKLLSYWWIKSFRGIMTHELTFKKTSQINYGDY
jgi:hypothetical protein